MGEGKAGWLMPGLILGGVCLPLALLAALQHAVSYAGPLGQGG